MLKLSKNRFRITNDEPFEVGDVLATHGIDGSPRAYIAFHSTSGETQLRNASKLELRQLFLQHPIRYLRWWIGLPF